MPVAAALICELRLLTRPAYDLIFDEETYCLFLICIHDIVVIFFLNVCGKFSLSLDGCYGFSPRENYSEFCLLHRLGPSI